MNRGDLYLKDHGISEEFAKSQGLTWDDNALYIPVKDINEKILFEKTRNLNYTPEGYQPKYKNAPGSSATLFNLHKIRDSPEIVICEGEIDCLKLSQEEFPAVSSTGGTSTFKPEWAEHFEDKRVWVCYDADGAGKIGAERVLKLIPHAREIRLPEGIKDICDYFIAGYTKEDFSSLMEATSLTEEIDVNEIARDMLTLTMKDLYEIKYEKEAFIIDRFLPVAGMTMVSGDSGVGKSWIALDVIRSISDNTLFLDHFAINHPKVPILLIDKENGLRRIQLRSKGMGIINSEDIHIIEHPHKFNLTDEVLLEEVRDLIIEKEIKVVIVDSFVDILIGSENDSADISTVFNTLRSISTEVSWLLLHHESKPVPNFRRSSGDRARGSSNIKAQVDYLFSAQRTKKLKIINIEQGKARDYEKLPKFAIEFLSNGEEVMTGFRYVGEVQDEITKVEEAGEFLLEFIDENPNATIKAIEIGGDARGITKASLKRARDMLIEKQLIESTPDPTNKKRKLFNKLEVSEE
jgi:RecA-family ATPase